MSESKQTGGEDFTPITIELTEEQQELIRRESNGSLDISAFKLRPDIAIARVLEQQDASLTPEDLEGVKTAVAPPPRGTYWA